MHYNELLPFNSVPVEELQKEQSQANIGNGSETEQRVPDLMETESPTQSSSESSSHVDDHDNEDTVAQLLPPQTHASSRKPPKRPQRQRKPPGW